MARIYKQKSFISRANGAAARHLLDLAFKEAQQAKKPNLLLLMGAQDRVIAFLHEMAGRSETQTEFELPMIRRDIADYLDLTIETVSRVLSINAEPKKQSR